jgi:hypothetical protein
VRRAGIDWSLSLCAGLLAAALQAGELKPGQVITLTFPELPPTLIAQAKGEKAPAMLTARLPDNYTAEGRWPLFVFVAGGVGSKGDGVGNAREIIGPRDFIAVSLPLFQRAYDPQEQPGGGMAITVDDFDVLRSAYRTMLGGLMQTVTNTTPERSTLGGFSNGAHATALLVAGGDEFTLDHFSQFVFVDGGAQFLAPFGLSSTKLARSRLLLLRGDQREMKTMRQGQPPVDARAFLDKIFDAVDGMARARGLDWTQVVMRGRGHGFEPEFRKVVGQWARGEKMDDVPPKE